MSLRSLIAGVSLTIALLSGCSTVPESVHPVEWQQHQATLAEIEQFQVTGKLGYISPEQRQSLNFYWDHRPYFSELRFTTLLGQTALKLTMTPDGASIETYDDEQFTASDATSLIYQLTGLLLPVQQLPDWLLGLPEGTDQFRLSPQNTLASLDQTIGQQPPWHIEYTQYQDVPFAQQILPLPRKLKLIQSDTKLNIVVTKWTLTP